MALIQIPDQHVVREFQGELIAENRTHQPLRWAEFRIYRHAEGGYVLHRAGRSVVYHRADTTCRTAGGTAPGIPATVAGLPDDATPCEKCQPSWPLDLEDDEPVRMETDRNTVDRCQTAADVVDALTRFRQRGTGKKIVKVSEPVAELLELAARADPAFADVPPPVERIA